MPDAGAGAGTSTISEGAGAHPGTPASTEPGTPARPLSLTARLAIALVIVFAGAGTGVVLAALAYGRHAAEQAYDRLLIGAASQVADAVSLHDGEVVVDLPLSAFELLALAPDDRIVYAVFGPGGERITGHDLSAHRTAPDTLADVRIDGVPFRLATMRRAFAERTFSGEVEVVVGQTVLARRALAREIAEQALIIAAGAGVLTLGIAVFAVKSALAPLRRIEQAISRREPQDLTPLDTPVPREITGLVAALNRFMARLDRRVGIMRRLIAEASHQLRTPIAALRVQADLAAEETDPERQRAIVARIHDRAVSLGRLTDQLLSQALIIHRADAVTLTPVDLREVAIGAVEESDHDLLVSDAELRLEVPEEPVSVPGDRVSLVEACKNLVANAIRHGRPPVTLEVRRDGAGASLAVCDQGPGIPEEQWPDAARHFARASGVSQHSAGLGLAIVDRVARAHGGRLRFARPAEGGFEAALVLPGPAGADA